MPRTLPSLHPRVPVFALHPVVRSVLYDQRIIIAIALYALTETIYDVLDALLPIWMVNEKEQGGFGFNPTIVGAVLAIPGPVQLIWQPLVCCGNRIYSLCACVSHRHWGQQKSEGTVAHRTNASSGLFAMSYLIHPRLQLANSVRVGGGAYVLLFLVEYPGWYTSNGPLPQPFAPH